MRLEVEAIGEPTHDARDGRQGEALRGAAVWSEPEGHDRLPGRERRLGAQPAALPPVGVEGVESVERGRVGEREHRAERHAGREAERGRSVVELDVAHHRAQDHRTLADANRLERAPFDVSGVAVAHLSECIGVQREQRDRPAERGEQVGHCRDVQQGDVASDALRARRFGGVGPPDRDLAQEAAAGAVGQQLADHRLVAGQRGALRRLVGRRDREHPVGMHERVGAVEPVELGDEPVEPRLPGGAVADPAREAEAVADTPGEREGVELAVVTELVPRRARARGRGGRDTSRRPARRTGRAPSCARPRTTLRAVSAPASGSRRGPCSRRARAARRALASASGENTKRYRSRPETTSNVSPSSARARVSAPTGSVSVGSSQGSANDARGGVGEMLKPGRTALRR